MAVIVLGRPANVYLGIRNGRACLLKQNKKLNQSHEEINAVSTARPVHHTHKSFLNVNGKLTHYKLDVNTLLSVSLDKVCCYLVLFWSAYPHQRMQWLVFLTL